ncbi:cytochrome P450 monooxygenase pc-1 [Mycena latifolia]|nr:cytochrome P450 monooxygenase pc-1 [Mycena latifolia]
MPPPGVSFLARLTLRPRVLTPLALGFVFHYVAMLQSIKIPMWATVFLVLASVPLYLTYRIMACDAHQRREAEAMGGRLAQGSQVESVGTPVRDGFIDFLQDGGALGAVVNVRVLWIDLMFTVWPEHIKNILATDFNNYVKGQRFQYNVETVLGTGVFNSDGEMWKFHRGMTRPFFSRDKISHFDIFDRHAVAIIGVMKERTRAGFSIDFQDLIGRFTMDSATEFLFGTCVSSLKANIPYAHNVGFPPPQSCSTEAQKANTFIEAFNEAMQVIAEREYAGPVWPLFEVFRDKSAAPMKIVSAFLDPVIHAAVQRKKLAEAKEKEKSDGEPETLLDELLNSTSDPKVLKDETIKAGRDTTMHVMTMVIYFLSMYPEVCTRLREEVLAYVGPTRRPTYDDIKGMKYLRAVINESMRLYPPVESVNASTWPSPDPREKPIYIPAGTKCVLSPLGCPHATDAQP